jgi:anaerobic ribonucleoside-triphosphate reductase activating protein
MSGFFSLLMLTQNIIYVSHYLKKTRVLGPYARSAFWVQGCPFDCGGCMSPEMRGPGGTAFECQALALKLVSEEEETEGVTISGGEPFAQAGAVALVVSRMKELADCGVIVYTGYRLEELEAIAKHDSGTAELLGRTDILIDGRYEAARNDGRPYRGSSNQRILRLTHRYDGVFDSYYNNPGGRRVEIALGPGRVTLAGVPSAAALETWKDMLAARGILSQSRPPLSEKRYE